MLYRQYTGALCAALILALAVPAPAQRHPLERREDRRAEQAATATLTLNPLLPQQFALWQELPMLAGLRIHNPLETAGEAELHVQITTPGGQQVAQSRDFNPTILVIPSGGTTLHADDLFRNLDLEWYDSHGRRPVIDDTLAGGQYLMCLHLKPRTPRDTVPSIRACAVFSAVDLLRPVPRTPDFVWNSDSTALYALHFSWQYPIDTLGAMLPGVQWLLRIVEAPDGTPSPGALDNQPAVFERVVEDFSGFTFVHPASIMKRGRTYLWSVRPYTPAPPVVLWPQPSVFTIPSAPAPQEH